MENQLFFRSRIATAIGFLAIVIGSDAAQAERFNRCGPHEGHRCTCVCRHVGKDIICSLVCSSNISLEAKRSKVRQPPAITGAHPTGGRARH